MKILFVCAGVPSEIGQIHVLQLLKVLACDHQVTVIAFDGHQPYLAGRTGELANLAEVITIPFLRKSLGGRVARSFFSLEPVAVQGAGSDEFRNVLARVLAEAKYDLVLFEQLVMGQYAPLARDVPRFFFPVDAVSRRKWQHVRTTGNPIKKIILAVDASMTQRYERRIYNQFASVVFVSKRDAAYALDEHQAPASKLAVLPLSVDTQYFAPNEGDARQYPSLAFLGNMRGDNKDAILWFSRAVWPELKHAVPELKLLVVGNDPTRKVRELGIHDCSIIVTGYLRDIRPPICHTSVFIAPLRAGTGINNRVLQAMAMGKAIVGSPLSVEGLDVQDGKEILVAGDADAFVRQILFLLRNPGERERLGREARCYVERNHSLSALAERFAELACRTAAQAGEKLAKKATGSHQESVAGVA